MSLEAAINPSNNGFNLRGGPLLWMTATILCLAFNFLLFGMMPMLMSKAAPDRPKNMDMGAVSVIRQKKDEQPARKREVVEKRKEPQKAETKTLKSLAPPKPAVDKPRLAFAVNPRLPAAPGGLDLPPLEHFTMDAQPEGPAMRMDFLANELDSPLTPVRAVPPLYPFRARKMGIEGYVTVQFSVNENGEISDLKVTDAKPKGIFEQEVLRCVSAWRYAPPTVDGRPVRTRWERTIEFVLE